MIVTQRIVIMSGMIKRQHQKRIIDQAIHESIHQYNKDKRRKKAFVSLLEVVRRESNLLHPEHILKENHPDSLRRCFYGLANITHHFRDWLKDPACWSTERVSLRKQFQSLVDYLFTTKPVPNFMLSVWLEEPSYYSRKRQIWYKHVGMGNNIRGADIQVTLTKKMAERFMKAPDHYSAEQALYYSMNGFPEKPNPFEFGISKKRKITLMNQIKTKKRLKSLLHKKWAPAPIADFSFVEDDPVIWKYRHWSIHQLRNRAELIHEGNQLHHCVADYSRLCSLGVTSIWSMKCSGRLSSRHSVTIEVDPENREIIQARGICNRWPTDEEQEIIRKWAEREELRIAI